LSSVIRNSRVARAPQYFGGGEPRFVGEDAQALIEQARAEAFERGRREGHAAGRAEMQASAQRLEAALASAALEAHQISAAAVEHALAAGWAVAEFVVGRADPASAAEIAQRIETALQRIDDAAIVVAVNPSDWEAVVEHVTVPVGVTVERDPGIKPGEAELRGRWASVELTREAALAVAREVLG
jgi:flagellar biosynthesis/type III secretory pathway protein FliH